MSRLTHQDDAGRAHMVDVSDKAVTPRRARAAAFVRMSPSTLALLVEGGLPKGDALAVARLAAVQGAKRTSDLIPLCHSIALDAVACEAIVVPQEGVRLETEVRCHGRTGVEMEALCAAAAGALALYDMIKGVDRAASIESIVLLEKEGGKSGTYRREAAGEPRST